MQKNYERWLCHKYDVNYMIMQGNMTMMEHVLGNVVISKKILRTRKIMVMHSNERGECVHVPS